MKAVHTRYFEKVLICERIHALRALHRLESEEAEPQSTSAGDTVRGMKTPADAASETLEQETDFALATRFSERLAALDAALVTLRDHPDRFGVCASCGGLIGPWRLHLVPWTTECAECAGCDVGARAG